MGVYRSTNPQEWDDVDGIIINETAPPPSIQGVSSNIAILVGQFQRGPSTLEEPGSIGELHELYGKSDAKGNLAIKNKRFGRLKIIRVIASGAAKASRNFVDGVTNIINFEAKYPGAYGNSIKVTIAAGTGGTSTYTIQDTSADAVLPTEVYANLAITAITSATFANSKLVTATVLATSGEPDPIAATSLSGGSDGTVADGDYEDALAAAEVEESGNILFLDEYNATRCGYLEVHAATTQDKIVVLAGAESDSVSTAVAAVANYRDTEGRIVYAYPWVQTVVNGASTYTSPASWVASVISQTASHVDPASVTTRDFMVGATGLKSNLTRAQFIQLKEAGIAAFENSRGFIKLKSGITTQIADSSKVMILRRRMADYLTQSAAKYLENYQNVPNKKNTRAEIAAGILDFVIRHENEGILPKDSEVSTGKAKLVDSESLNTDSSIAAGFAKILWKQRIYSSMRFIVLQAEIGESVTVTAS